MLNRKTSSVLLALILSTAPLSACFDWFSSDKPLTPVVYSDLEGKAWVENCIQQYPEILWLADANVRKTEEGDASDEGSYSEQLFGKKYVEFDRTIMTLHCLRLILNGSDRAYQEFTAAQPEDVKLSRQSFAALHEQGAFLLRSNWNGLSEKEMAQAMETSLVLGDMGKSEMARELFNPFQIKAPDHDDFHGEALHELVKHPDLCPSFARLPSAAKNLLVEMANLAHFGHVTHLEGTSVMLKNLRESQIASKDPAALGFDLFVHTCDVAGAAGQINHRSSLVYSELTHRAMQAMESAVGTLADPFKTEKDAYFSYLDVRASWLGLDPSGIDGRALARVGAMMRLFTPEDGAILKHALGQLDKKNRTRIVAHLDVKDEEQPGRTPTYMPAVLVNLMNNKELGATREERLVKAVEFGLPFIGRVLEKHKTLLTKNQIDPNVPLNFNQAAGIAKSSPDLLKGSFTIDNEGNVIVARS